MKLLKHSLGIGDRFAHQARAQLTAIVKAKKLGIEITPVWNKSFREHQIIHSRPSETRREADNAIRDMNFKGAYFVDADHINRNTVGFFLDHADFFTLDAAEFIGIPSDYRDVELFIKNHQEFLGSHSIPGIESPLLYTREFLNTFAIKYLRAIASVRKIYAFLLEKKGPGNFILEVSMDEVPEAQTPMELLLILEQLKDIPLQTIAPKFTGQFYKGVDYVGDMDHFSKDFDQTLSIISHAKKEFGCPHDLKISIHSGSDKFSLYPIIKRLCIKHAQGIHLKTAGTTWLEEIIGLSLSGREGLTLVKDIYNAAYAQLDALCAPYKSVVNIDPEQLPQPTEVRKWSGDRYANTLRHVQSHPDYNPHFRQLIHVGYKVAADMGHRYLEALETYKVIIGRQVTENLLERHIKPLF